MAETRLKAQALTQKSYTLYLFKMNSVDLNRLCYVTPRSNDDPNEIQRILKESRAEEIGEYIKQENSLLPNAIVVNLSESVRIDDTEVEDEKLIVLPSGDEKVAYILDGQHRLAGFNHSGGIQFDLPVVATHNASPKMRGKIFADINSEQVKVTEWHILSLYYQIKELSPDESATMDVVYQLATDPDSPLYEKVKMKDDDKGTWITNTHLKRCIQPHTRSGGVLSGKTPAEQATILKEYLKAVGETWRDATEDFKHHMLWRAMGTEIILGLFEAAKHRCDLNSGRQYTQETFSQALAPLTEANVEIPGGGKVPLDWQRGKGGLGVLSNKPGKNLIRTQLMDTLRAADEDE